MKRLTLIALMLSSIIILFSSCKKETLYRIDITWMGLVNSIEYSVNGVVLGNTKGAIEFDAKEGDNIVATVSPGGSVWNFSVYGHLLVNGKVDRQTIMKTESQDTGITTISFTLPHSN